MFASRLIVVLGTLCASVLASELGGTEEAAEGRRVLCLNGVWQLAEGSMDEMPTSFEHTVPVPGLVDMASSPLEQVGVDSKDKRREAFWYRRTFRLEGALPEVARLKIHKAKFGARVFLNGELVGDHLPCFTPAVFDVRKFLHAEGQENVLTVRVGSCRESIPKSIPDGFDFEKKRYLPGIYDSVELILSVNPHIVRIQAVPDLKAQTVRVIATLGNTGKPAEASVKCRVLEVATDKLVSSAQADPMKLDTGREPSVELTLPIPGCRQWSPEDPFLYRLEATTGTDTVRTRFGMRSFQFDPKTKQALRYIIKSGEKHPFIRYSWKTLEEARKGALRDV